MDEPNSDIDWNHVRALLATVEAGSLSAAARRLGLTQPTLGRQVAALEQTLGVTRRVADNDNSPMAVAA